MKSRDEIYVLYVGGAQEKRVIHLIEQLVPSELYTEVFSPKYQRRMKLSGDWRIVESPLVPGYLFITSAEIEELHKSLQRVPALTKLLSMGSAIVALEPAEATWLNRLTKPFDRTVSFSEGYMIGDQVFITNGPLKGYESEIVKIDRHKRFAYLSFHILGRVKNVRVGLEIVSKVPATT